MPLFDTVYSDDFLAVLEKHPGAVVAPSQTQLGPTIAEVLVNDWKIPLDRGGIVHRLDKDTSGLLLIAKTQEVLEALQAQFKERTVKKEYLCLVHGFLETSGTIEGAIGRNPGDREKFVVSPDGKAATTKYSPIQKYELSIESKQRIFAEFNKIQNRKLERSNYGQFTLVRCFPLTGRTHQIRVHLKYIDHAIVGDIKYGGRKTARLDGRWCKRQFLHAAKIQFIHPVTKEEMLFESGLPADLAQALSNLTLVT